MILPPGERIGAETDATPCSRSPTDCAQPRRRIPERAAAENCGVLEAAVHPLRVLPGQQDLGGRAGAHGQLRADGDRVAQARRALGGGDAHPVLALAAPQLRGLAGDVAEAGQHGAGRGEQPVLAGGGGQLGETRAEDEAALHVAGDQSVVLQGHRKAVRRGSGEAGARDQSGEGGRS